MIEMREERIAIKSRRQVSYNLNKILPVLPQSLNYKQAFKIAVSLILTILLLYLAFRNVDMDLMFRSLKQVKALYLIPTVGLSLLSLFIRSFLWREIFGKNNKIMVDVLFRSVVIGQMGNNIFPFRAGELLRIYSISKKQRISRSLCLSTVVIERMFDFVSLGVLAGLVFYFVKAPQFISVGLIVLSLGPIVILTFFSCIANAPAVVDLILKWLNVVLPSKIKNKFDRSFTQLVSGGASLNSLKAICVISLLSLTCWSIMCVSYFFAAKAYNLDANWTLPVFLFVLLNVGTLIPTLPGSLGVYQFVSVVALNYFGIEESVALGFSFILQAADIIPSTALGLFYFFREDIFDGIAAKNG